MLELSTLVKRLATADAALIDTIFSTDKTLDSGGLGRRDLNELGLYLFRAILADTIVRIRREQLGFHDHPDRLVFESEGHVIIPDFLPIDDYRNVRNEIRSVKKTISLTYKTRRHYPAVERLLRSDRLQNLLRMASAALGDHLVARIEKIISMHGDTQAELHIDTFHSNVKYWYFTDDTPPGAGTLMFAPKSHRITYARLLWEHSMSCNALESPSRDHREGSFRLTEEESKAMGYEEVPIAVKGNTLVLADTRAIHRRGIAPPGTTRFALHGLVRVNPFSLSELPGTRSSWR